MVDAGATTLLQFCFSNRMSFCQDPTFSELAIALGRVVQRPISANPGLKVNLLFCFHTFWGTVNFQTSQNKTFINSY